MADDSPLVQHLFDTTRLINFDERVYTCLSSITINRTCKARGAFAARNRIGTVLWFPPGVPGLILTRAVGGEGDYCIFEDFSVQSDPWDEATPDAHGITVLSSRSTFRNVIVQGFSGDGWHIEGNTTQHPPPVNTNWGMLDHCGSHKNRRHGLAIVGADANCWKVHIDTSGNGGWGVYEPALVGCQGNMYEGCHASANGEGPYCLGDAKSTLVHCYSEGPDDGRGSWLGWNAFSLMGNHGAGKLDTNPFEPDKPFKGGSLEWGWKGGELSPLRWFLFQHGADDSPGIDFGSGPPTTGAWKRGWRRYDSTPTAGQWAGWLCVKSTQDPTDPADQGVWRKFAKIELL